MIKIREMTAEVAGADTRLSMGLLYSNDGADVFMLSVKSRWRMLDDEKEKRL